MVHMYQRIGGAVPLTGRGPRSGVRGRGTRALSPARACARRRKVTGVPIEYEEAGRRPGDPPRLVGNADKARRELGWTPEYVDLVSIVQTAWRYMEARAA